MKIEAIAHKRIKNDPVVELTEAKITCESGVANDLAGSPSKRQITLLSSNVWQEVSAVMKQEIPWTVRRANLLISEVRFGPEHVGRVLEIGDVQLEVTKETVPCKLMDDQVPGLRTVMESDWRGGVCGRVLKSGFVKVGDTVEWLN